MPNIHRRRRFIVVFLISLAFLFVGLYSQSLENQRIEKQNKTIAKVSVTSSPASEALEQLVIKGRAPKTGYSRDMFGNGWRKTGECDTRNDVLARDMTNVVTENCKVYSGILDDPYTGKKIYFTRGPDTSDDVQIDHVDRKSVV